ncbi:MAG: CRISPR-associated endonuclease Cas4g/Cas1g [Thermoplasmata archaeon]
MEDEKYLLPARMLNEYVYCPRLFYYESTAKEFDESSDTLEGTYAHRNIDGETGKLTEPEEDLGTESRINARSVLLSSSKHGLISRMDIVEGDSDEVWPVEYKKGKSPGKDAVWPNDSIQLCAQAIILRENGYNCNHGYVYYDGSHERIRVEISDELVRTTLAMAKSARELSLSSNIPDPLSGSRKCERCSLVSICLPDETLALKSCGELKKKGEVRMLYPARDDALPLYVQEQGAYISKKDEELEIRVEGDVVSRVKLLDVSGVSLFGNVQITTQTVHELLRRNMTVAYFTTGGWFQGLLNGMPHKNVELRIRQYRIASKPDDSLKAARSFIYGKIRNGRTLLRRNAKRDVTLALRKLSDLSRSALNAEDGDQLLGIEGSAARVYFQHFKDMISASALQDAFDFSSRNRRPPKDPVNALLSFNYALLTREVSTILLKVGFDPYLGFLHSHKYGSPALALDLMEEFRPIIGDSIVISMLNTGEVDESDFVRRGGAVALNGSGRRKAIKAYERRMNVLVSHPIFGYSVSYRRILEVQARLLSRWVNEEIREYPVFMVR